MGFKTYFLEKFEDEIKSGAIKSICDFGCGESLNFIPLLRKYPNLIYVGIEPSPQAEMARKNLAEFKNAKIFRANGYSCPEGAEEWWGKFDLVISFSVLEHVKQLERFLKSSIEAARVGGQIVHRWDLGHALLPSSLKERFQVWLGDNLPSILPEHKFVCYLGPQTVLDIMEKYGFDKNKVTYHQMIGHKKLAQELDLNIKKNEDLINEIAEWEFKISESLEKIPERKRLKLFPAVALWGKKI